MTTRFWAIAVAGLLALALPLAAAPPAGAAAAEIVPAVIFAVGQKFDKSFNEAAFTAAERFKADTGIGYLEFQPQAVAEFERGVAALVRRGATDIVAIGFYYATPLDRVAPRFPQTRFTLIDAVVDQPNVSSVVYKEQEGAFLIGMLAAMASKTGKLGFIGALDIPLLRKYIAGYEQGAQFAVPGASVLVNFVGTTPAAFNDPTTGAEVARGQFERGVDVVFAGAGSSNFGIFQQAADLGRLAIGVDSNQNYLHPGAILTSMLKRVDLAVLQAFTSGRDGSWRGGVHRLGLAEQGVDYAVDQYNAALITDAMRQRVEQARQDIIGGKITVADPSR
ncbi:MAG: BMP family ABC transporter substrate-binding protein [Azospirillum sp.]|nr:BMP family ABC transporter substrate-binding protein [Azospirillum sp.]